MTNKNKFTKDELLGAIRKLFTEECDKRGVKYYRTEGEDARYIDFYTEQNKQRSFDYEYVYLEKDSSIEEAKYDGVNIFDEVVKRESFFIEIKRLRAKNTYSVKFLRNQTKYCFYKINKEKLKECMRQVLRDPIKKLSCKQEYSEFIRGGYINQFGNPIDMENVVGRIYDYSVVNEFDNHVVLDKFSFAIGDLSRFDLTGFYYDSIVYPIRWAINEVLKEIDSEGNAREMLDVQNMVELGLAGGCGRYATFKIILHFKKQ